MTQPTTIAASDYRPLSDVFTTQTKSVAERAKLAAELERFISSFESGTTARTDLRNSVVNYRQDLDRRLAGHLPFPDDPIDDTQNALAVVKTIGDAAPLVGGITDGPFGYVVGLGAREGVKSFVSTGQDFLSIPGVQNMISDWRARNGAAASADLTDRFGPEFQSAVDRAASIAAGNPEALKALRDLYPQVFVSDDATVAPGSVMQCHPEVYSNYYAYITVKADNSVLITDIDKSRAAILNSITGLGADVSAGFATVTTHLDIINSQQDQIAASTAGIAKFLSVQAATEHQRAEVERQRAAAAATMKAEWDGASGTVAVAAGIANLLGYPALAKDITRYGQGVITLTKSVVDFVNGVSALAAGFQVVSALGTAAATGNVIGAVAGLVGLFAPQGPPPEQLILDELGRIQGNLHDLSKQFADGLGRIDARLNTIYTNVMTVLGQLSTLQTVTLEEVRDLERNLVAQEVLLREVMADLDSRLTAAERLELAETVDAALAYSSRTSAPLPQDRFNEYASTFFTWATVAAKDGNNEPLAGRAVDQVAVGTELVRLPVTDNLSYINAVLRSRGLPTFSNDAGSPQKGQAPLANPDIWAVAAAAYAQLCSEWPALAPVDDPRLSAIAQPGLEIRTGVRSLQQDAHLFSATIDSYRTSAEAFGASLDEARKTFQSKILPMLLGYGDNPQLDQGPVDVFGPLEQDVRPQRQLTRMQCADGGPELDGPKDATRFIPPLFAFADWLDPHAQKVAVQYRVSAHTVQVTHVNPKTGDEWTTHEQHYQARIDITYMSLPVRDICSLEGKGGPAAGQSPNVWFAQNWTAGLNFKAVVDRNCADFTHVPPGTVGLQPQAVEQANQAISSALAEARKALYAYLADQSQSPNGSCHGAAMAFDGDRRLTDALVQLIFPIPRSADDLLRALLDGPPSLDGGVNLPDLAEVRDALIRMGSTTPPVSAHTFADWLMALVGEIPEQVLARVQHWMDAIANKTFSNALPGIDDTLMRLDVARSVTHWNARISSPPKPPGTNKIRQLQQVVHVPIDGLWGPQTDAALTLVRMAAFRHQITDVKALQRACGTTPDGQWGPTSKAALTRTVKGIQTIIGVPADGAWGPKTDAAYQQFRLTNQRW